MPSQFAQLYPDRRAFILGVVLPAALLAGLAVRLYHLDAQTLTHPEFWVPRIEMPEYVHHPPQRMNAAEVVSQTLSNDKHPPGYHLVMLVWNSVFGTELFAMRLSSVLFGILALGALYFYARKSAGTAVAVLATWLLALHGFHVFWSKQLRPWVLLSFLAILSSLLLIKALERWRPATAAGYALVAGLGLWVEYYFWPIFAAQIVWVLLQSAGRRVLSPALWAQALALIVATPVFIYLRHQIGVESHVPTQVWPFIRQMLQFGGVLHVNQLSTQMPDLAPWISALVGLAGAIALAAGLRESARERGAAIEDPPSRDDWQPSVIPLFVAAFLVVVIVEVIFAPLIGHRRLFLAAALAPWLVAGAWLVLVRTWPIFSNRLSAVARIPVVRHVVLDLTAMLAVGVFLMLTVVHLAKPILADYALVSLAPFYILLSARGVYAARRTRPLVAGALIGLCLFSVYQWSDARISNRDYKGLAEQLVPHIRADDVVLVEEKWWTSPIHYYLKPGEFRVVPPPPASADPPGDGDIHLPDRVWIIDFGPEEELEERIRSIAVRLPNFEERTRIAAYNAGAALFERRSAAR